jgi:hypothetical protein
MEVIMPKPARLIDRLSLESRHSTMHSMLEAEGTNVTSIRRRWGYDEVFVNGWLPVPTLFLKVYGKLKPYPLTPGEAMFVLELMSYKWTNYQLPYPSYRALAERMGVTDKMVRRYAQQLEAKYYLKRKARKNQTNEFDLSGLFLALKVEADEKQSAGSSAPNLANNPTGKNK